VLRGTELGSLGCQEDAVVVSVGGELYLRVPATSIGLEDYGEAGGRGKGLEYCECGNKRAKQDSRHRRTL